jgi:hypothetical protein
MMVISRADGSNECALLATGLRAEFSVGRTGCTGSAGSGVAALAGLKICLTQTLSDDCAAILTLRFDIIEFLPGHREPGEGSCLHSTTCSLCIYV